MGFRKIGRACLGTQGLTIGRRCVRKESVMGMGTGQGLKGRRMVDDGDRRGRLETIVILLVFILFLKLELGAWTIKEAEERGWIVHLKKKR